MSDYLYVHHQNNFYHLLLNSVNMNLCPGHILSSVSCARKKDVSENIDCIRANRSDC